MNIYIYMHTYVCITYTHTYKHAYITYIHTYIHTYLQQPTEGAHHAAPMHKELAHSSRPLEGARVRCDPKHMQGTRAPQEPLQPCFAFFAWGVHAHYNMWRLV